MTRSEGRWLCKTNWYAWKAAGDWWILLTPQKNKGSCGKWSPLWVSVASLLNTGLSLFYYQTMKKQCLGVEQRGWREFNIPRELTLFFILWWGEQLKQLLGTVLFQLSNGPSNVDGSAGTFPLGHFTQEKYPGNLHRDICSLKLLSEAHTFCCFWPSSCPF